MNPRALAPVAPFATMPARAAGRVLDAHEARARGVRPEPRLVLGLDRHPGGRTALEVSFPSTAPAAGRTADGRPLSFGLVPLSRAGRPSALDQAEGGGGPRGGTSQPHGEMLRTLTAAGSPAGATWATGTRWTQEDR